jgi:hypothetical protein
MPYGSAEEVAALDPLWTDGGEFTDPDIVYDDPGTNPTLSRVELWLEQVSDLMDLALAQYGFTAPVTALISEKAVRILDLKVSAMVADLVHLSHDTGRLFSDRIRETGEEPLTILERELISWVNKRINALETLIPRTIDQAEGSSYSVPSGRQL